MRMEEGKSSSGKKRSLHKDEFTDLVLSMSIEEIFDEDMYKHQVDKMPESFESVDQYLGSYVFPLLEETRQELASALETIGKAPFADVTDLSDSKGVYSVKIDNWRNRVSDRGKEPYSTLPGDIMMLTNSKPETASDLQRFGWKYTFASVTSITEDEDGGDYTTTNFKVKTREQFEVEGWLHLHKPLYVVFMTNILTNKRIWKALHMRRNLMIIENVFSWNKSDQEDCESCYPKCNYQMGVKVEPALLSKLNESQTEAILASLLRIECSHKPSVKLLWGPPGTGKTMTLSVFLYSLLRMNIRTVICAPTNVAITQLASRVIKLVQGSSEAEFGKGFLPCPLGDMLIFGNKARLKVGSDIEEIFLDYRVDQLAECLGPLTGWKSCVVSMIDFLKNCISQYHIYMENELSTAKRVSQDGIPKFKPVSLLEFGRERFKHTALPLKNCMVAFITHLPRGFIREQNFQYMVEFISILDNIETALFDNKTTSDELENIFSREVMIDASDSFVGSSSLMHMRNRSVSILRSLLHSLDTLDLPRASNRMSTVEFCFQKASLIFCTTSSSYKLHSVDMEPLHLLVIDEAAQVKECESVIALQLPDVRHAILVGDECQLPAIVSSKLAEEAGFGRSLFERLSSLGHSKHLLNTQYRMHPSISRFPNSSFYDNQIIDAPIVQSQKYGRCYLQGKMFGPYSFINVVGGKEELDDVGHSRRNMVEVAAVVKLVQKLYKAWNGSKQELSIGVISPYASQVMAIQNRLSKKYENLDRFVVKVKSVDGFQGGEEDIIIISTVRSNNHGSIGFLSNPQRTNVALTRARYCLWILGNAKTLSMSNSVWEALISDAMKRQCLFSIDEDCDVAKTIVDVKKEQDLLEDLLDGDSILFKNARWKVLFSDNFRKSFGKLKPSYVKKLVTNILLKLASGWRPKKVNVDWIGERSSHVVKQFKVEGYHVVCTIDIMKDTVYKQILKVWDVLPFVEVPNLLKRLDNIFAMYTDDFTNLCKEIFLEGNLEVPKSWSMSDELLRFKNLHSTKSGTDSSACAVDNKSYVENSRVSESLLLMKFYSLSTGTVNHLLTDHGGKEIDLPFEVTDEERNIIIYPESSFILGRSGTGKTTILTMKLYRKLQQYSIASRTFIADDSSIGINRRNDVGESLGEDMDTNLRQLFVTVSPKLCYAVKKHVSQLKSFANGNFSADNTLSAMDDINEMAEFKDIPDTFIGVQPEKYPLIITFHKFIMMLDGTLGTSYFERFPAVRDFARFDHRSLRSVALQTFIRKNEITYERFLSFYWPHFNLKMTKNLDPSRVFTEIISHIKGGLRDGEACESKRSREEYVSLSDSRVSTLSAQQREMVYDIFQDYEKIKMKRGEFDLADLVIDIHFRLNNEKLLGEKMDFVYIDEVQDLTMRQIALFRYICRNVNNGFVFSGDTAQTIARGIDFRFEDIRSLFYNEFLMKSKNLESGGRRDKGHMSDIFNLSQNFRTHAGVLRLSQSVIDLLCHFFPLSVDVLPPETSLIYGDSPVLLEPGSNENSIMTIFGHSKTGGKWVGFGAEQVILVRDDSARKEISAYIGQQALVLTIVECKGLEFQDVLLYNFFGSSPMSNQWRVVYEFLKDKDLLDTKSPESFPSFNQSRHNILCSELKRLYVAITRTKQRLWICENNESFFKPMSDYWRKLGLVQVRKVDDSILEAMQRASNPEEWKSQGIKLFWEKNYEMATICFEKAGEEMWEKRAKASGLRATADNLRSSNSAEADIMLRQAAEMFDEIGKADSAAECFCDLGEYERAGRIYLEKCGELRKSGECFTLAKCYNTAAEVYFKGNFFADCLSACTEGKCFDMGLHYIESWKNRASSNRDFLSRLNEIDKIGQAFLESAALECHKANDNTSLIKFVRAFHTMESKRNFLKSLDCLKELLVLEEESRNFSEAAEIAKQMGDLLSEVDLLGKAENFGAASSLIILYVLSNSLWVSRSQGWPLKSFPQKEELLEKALSFAHNVSGSYLALISTEAEILSHGANNLAELMRSYFASTQCGSLMGEILSVLKLLNAHFLVKPEKYEWEHELILDLKSYSDDRILMNQVSVRTLVYVWNLQKENSLKILECLESIERQDFDEYERTVEFCLKYFGLRPSDNVNATYLLLKHEAEWVNNVDKRFIRWKRNVASIEARHFALAARKHWHQVTISVGLKVLEALEALYKFSVSKTLPKYSQSTCLTSIFDVAKFFTESKLLEIKKSDYSRFQNFLNLSMRYFEIVFPLDTRESLSENLISLRETELSKNLLEEIISKNINMGNVLTFGQLGKVVMIWLGSGNLSQDLCKRISECLGENPSWKSFVEILRVNRESDSTRVLPSTASGYDILRSGQVLDPPVSYSTEALSHKLYIALESTCPPIWMMKDYILPNCFIYLLERLLILVPHACGFFLTTKSSFVEWLICQQSETNPSSGLVTDEQFSTGIIFNFIAGVVQQFLCNSRDTAEWIRTSKINYKSYVPVLMLRLFMLLCLVCLNSSIPFSVLWKMLAIPHIRSLLPTEFREAIELHREDNITNTVARAFRIIRDPLVIIDLGETNLEEVIYPDAIVLHLKRFSCKREIVRTLFTTKSETSVQFTSVEENVSESSTHISSEMTLENESATMPSSSEMTLKNDSNLSTEKGKGDLQLNWDRLRRTFESLKNEKDGDLTSNFLKIKVNLKEQVTCLADEFAHFTELRSYSHDDDKDMLFEVPSMLEELKRLSSLLDIRDFDSEHLSTFGQILKSLETRLPRIDAALYHQFAKQNETDDNLVTGELNETDVSISKNSDTKDSAEAVNKQSNKDSGSSRGKGKNKNKKTGRKGKGGRRK